jgi:hypothetical protein
MRGGDSPELVTIHFPKPVNARYLRVLVKAAVKNEPFAALAELEVVPVGITK